MQNNVYKYTIQGQVRKNIYATLNQNDLRYIWGQKKDKVFNDLLSVIFSMHGTFYCMLNSIYEYIPYD